MCSDASLEHREALGLATDARQHTDPVRLVGHGLVAEARLIVARCVAGAFGRALITSFLDCPGERRNWRALGWEEVRVESCVHGAVLL